MPEKRSKNKFIKIRHHLKSSQIDEKLEMLNEIPTNNSSSIYIIEPEKIEVIPAVLSDLNLESDSNPAGTDTSGLFGPGGEVLTEQPPGDNSYILGPMISVYFPDGDYTAIGYVQENTRKVINLARLSGSIENWNGVDGFVSYSQLTLSQANWYKNEYLSNKVQDYRAFYIGIFEQINPNVSDPSTGVDIDALGRWFGKIIKTPKTVVPQTTNRTPAVVRGPDPNLPPGSANPKYSKKEKDSDRIYGSPAIGASRVLRSITDNTRYGGDKIVKGLPANINYSKDWSGGGKKIVDKMFGSPKNAQKVLGTNWYKTDYAAPIGTLRPGEVDVARMYQDVGDTRGVPWGNKSGNYWVGDAPVQGKRGIKNPFASQVSRGWSGFPEVQYSTAGGGIDMVKTSADDVVSLASKGSKTSRFLSRIVPGVSAAAAIVDVGIRVNRGDYKGAVVSALSAIPGPIGWVAFAAQVGLDAAGVTGGNYRKESVIFENTSEEVLKVFNDIGKDEYIRMLSLIMLSLKTNPDFVSLVIRSFYDAKLSDDEKKIIQYSLPKMLKYLDNKVKIKESKEFISESRQRIIRDLKKPVVLPEEKKEKIKHRPRVIGAPSRTVGQDLMKQAEVPTSFKPLEEKMWGKHEKVVNSRLSQERKNMTLDIVGTSDHAWEWLTEKNQTKSKDIMYGNFDIKKNFGKDSEDVKDKIISKEQIGNDYLIKMLDNDGKIITLTQSVLNERLHKKFEMKMLEQQTLQSDKDPLFKRVSKVIKPVIDYPDKPSKSGYPDEPPPEMINGYHPEYGKKVDYYKKLDNKSADIMNTLKTDDPQIDSEVEKQTSKRLSSRLKTHIRKNK